MRKVGFAGGSLYGLRGGCCVYAGGGRFFFAGLRREFLRSDVFFSCSLFFEAEREFADGKSFPV